MFTNGIKSGHLTIANFFEFLVKKTWIGKPYYTTSLSGQQIHINLIMLLVPAITEYFTNIQAWACSKYYAPNFVLCIDSLTLKMETIMRNFCQRLYVPTSTNRSKGMQEIYLHDVFDNEIVRQYFNDDDMLFFNFLFSNEGGLNLRNDIAHGFYLPSHYTNDKMLLLISALLRIAKFDIKEVITD